MSEFPEKFRHIICNEFKNWRLHDNLVSFQNKYKMRATLPRENRFSPEVLIPCYNHGRFLETALASVPSDVAVTVINDASTDNTLAIAEALKKKYTFKLINNLENLNQAGSLNRAISESENNLFIILNADDVLLKYCIPTLMNLFLRHTTIRMAGGSCIPFAIETTTGLRSAFAAELGYDPEPFIYGPNEAQTFRRLNDLNMTMSSCTFTRSAWQAVDGFWDFGRRICSHDDRDFQMRVCALFDVATIEEPLAMYRTTSSSGCGQSL